VPDIDFEVICGARRHWTVSWLRAHNYTDFRFLVEVRELTDEEAFRISDLENRAREDLSDIERARDYLKALGRHYGGSQKDMASASMSRRPGLAAISIWPGCRPPGGRLRRSARAEDQARHPAEAVAQAGRSRAPRAG
jgi:ParB-like chromosome segregation protein Spo0J